MIPPFLLQKEQAGAGRNAGPKKLSFIDRTMRNMSSFVSASFYQWHNSGKAGLLQSIDPRVKVLFLLIFVVTVNLIRIPLLQGAVAGTVLLLYLFSGTDIIRAYRNILVTGFFFGFLIFAPSALNIFNDGVPVVVLARFKAPVSWWIYHLPQEISITREGLSAVLILTARVVNSVSIVLLVLSTTGFERLVRALHWFRAPGIFLLTLTMSYKFIFILSQTVAESYRAMKMRWWTRGAATGARQIVAGRIGYLFRKSWERYELVYQSMTARGFDGSVKFHHPERIKRADCIFLAFMALFFAILLFVNALYG